MEDNRRSSSTEKMGVHREAKRIKRGEDKHRILPLDLTIEILSWLPAKSLVRFRRVCKLWLSITHHPHFIETHLRNIRARHPTLLLFPKYMYISIRDFTITRLDCYDDPSPRLDPKHVIRDVVIYASCNGLLLCGPDVSSISRSRTTLVVVNPVTGDSLTLPPSSPRAPPALQPLLTMPYFGFEPTTKEYKAVSIFIDDKHTLVCDVCTLGTDSSWRRIHASLDFCKFTHKGTALNGAIYWQTSICPRPGCQGCDRDDQALRFDLKEECFDRITLPGFENFYRGRTYDVGEFFRELQGTLCLPVFPDITSDSVVSPRMDIWVMTSNVKPEWSIKYSLMFPWEACRQPTPLLIHGNQILVHDHHNGGSRLQYHGLHPNSNNSYKQVYHQDKEFIYRVPFVHVESLVSLPS